MKISRQYYLQHDTLWLARDLIGKILCTRINSELVTSGVITETEAYLGINDKASHAWSDRRTPRTATMYCMGGMAYVYLCYGIHSLFNVVTQAENIPHAVLIRGIYPFLGKEIMNTRRFIMEHGLLSGPGKITKVLGIDTAHDRTDLTGNVIWLEDKKLKIPDDAIIVGTRIGVDYAGEDARLPYRFRLDPKAIGFLEQLH
jgi:DNA-3-methyladenine glycosylase